MPSSMLIATITRVPHCKFRQVATLPLGQPAGNPLTSCFPSPLAWAMARAGARAQAAMEAERAQWARARLNQLATPQIILAWLKRNG